MTRWAERIIARKEIRMVRSSPLDPACRGLGLARLAIGGKLRGRIAGMKDSELFQCKRSMGNSAESIYSRIKNLQAVAALAHPRLESILPHFGASWTMQWKFPNTKKRKQ